MEYLKLDKRFIHGLDQDVFAPETLFPAAFFAPTGDASAGFVLSYDGTGDATWITPPAGGVPGGGAGSLDELSDVTITTPLEGQVLRYDGAKFVNGEVALADVDGLSTALSSKQDELTGVGDVPGLSTAFDGKQSLSEKGQPNGYAPLDATGKVPSANLPAASGGGVEALSDLDDVFVTTPATGEVLRFNGSVFANSDLQVSDVDGLSVALSAKLEPSDLAGLQATSERGQPDGYASLDSSGKIPTSQLPAASGGGATELNDLDDVVLATPATGEVLRFNGSEFVNAEVALADVDGLGAALDSKQDELTGVGDVPGLSTALADKLETGDLEGLQATSEKGQPEGYAPLDTEGKVPWANLPAAAGSGVSALPDLDDVASDVDPGQGSLLVGHNEQWHELSKGAPGTVLTAGSLGLNWLPATGGGGGAGLPVGAIMYATEAPGEEWLPADGSSYEVEAYPELAAAMGRRLNRWRDVWDQTAWETLPSPEAGPVVTSGPRSAVAYAPGKGLLSGFSDGTVVLNPDDGYPGWAFDGDDVPGMHSHMVRAVDGTTTSYVPEGQTEPIARYVPTSSQTVSGAVMCGEQLYRLTALGVTRFDCRISDTPLGWGALPGVRVTYIKVGTGYHDWARIYTFPPRTSHSFAPLNCWAVSLDETQFMAGRNGGGLLLYNNANTPAAVFEPASGIGNTPVNGLAHGPHGWVAATGLGLYHSSSGTSFSLVYNDTTSNVFTAVIWSSLHNCYIAANQFGTTIRRIAVSLDGVNWHTFSHSTPTNLPITTMLEDADGRIWGLTYGARTEIGVIDPLAQTVQTAHVWMDTFGAVPPFLFWDYLVCRSAGSPGMVRLRDYNPDTHFAVPDLPSRDGLRPWILSSSEGGGGGGGGVEWVSEQLAGESNGVNPTFAASYPIEDASVYLNGDLMATADYEVSADTVIFSEPPEAGDHLQIRYRRGA